MWQIFCPRRLPLCYTDFVLQPGVINGNLKSKWQPIVRIGSPQVRYRPQWKDDIQISVRTAPRYPAGWQDFFNSKVKEIGIDAAYDFTGPDHNSLTSNASSDDLERVVAAIDSALDHANACYEQQVLPHLIEADRAHQMASTEKARRQADLEQRAAKLAKPELD
jgi:hypothetical protein